MEGIIVVNKPNGMTSHDVVRRVRQRFKMKRVGHLLAPDRHDGLRLAEAGRLPVFSGCRASLLQGVCQALDGYVEADCLLGPILRHRADAAGCVYSMAYGDQPALISEQACAPAAPDARGPPRRGRWSGWIGPVHLPGRADG